MHNHIIIDTVEMSMLVTNFFISCSKDSIRMMEAYCDVIVLRHPEPGAAKVSEVWNLSPPPPDPFFPFFSSLSLSPSHLPLCTDYSEPVVLLTSQLSMLEMVSVSTQLRLCLISSPSEKKLEQSTDSLYVTMDKYILLYSYITVKTNLDSLEITWRCLHFSDSFVANSI